MKTSYGMQFRLFSHNEFYKELWIRDRI